MYTPNSYKETDLSLEFLMGRALDNAMLNTGFKDIARGMSNYINVMLQYPDSDCQTALRSWASALKTLFNKNMMLPLAMVVSAVSLHVSSTAWPL